MQLKRSHIILVFIFIFSFLIRICQLESLPQGTHPDEASWGYNAYSILETGKDEHGASYPLIFKAFGDQKLPVYTYAVVLSVKLFGLSNFAVRFPSVIAGSFLPVLIYLLLRQCKLKDRSSLLGALIVAISPWTIILSRIFTPDSNVALLFFTSGIYFALKSLENKKTTFILLSGFLFALTWYSYVAYRLISPITLLIIVAIFFRKDFLPNKMGKALLLTFLIGIIPLIILGFKGTGSARFLQVLSTPVTGMILEINENRTFCNSYLPSYVCSIHDNKILSYSVLIIERYVKTFFPQYLFLEGEKDQFINVKHYGLLYLPLLLPYLSGIIYFGYKTLNKKLTKIELFILCGLILTPSAALIVNEPVKTRLSALVPFMILFITTGYEYFLTTLKSVQFKKYFHLLFTSFLCIITIFFMIDLLFIHIPKNDFTYKSYAVDLMRYLSKIDKKTQIYIASYDESIIVYAFVNKVDPTFFQKNVKRYPEDEIGFAHASDLLNIHNTRTGLHELYCQHENDQNPTLYVSQEDLLSNNVMRKAEKILYSYDKTTKFAYVYNLRDLTTAPNCNK